MNSIDQNAIDPHVSMHRNDVIAAIRAALRRRSGKTWSVTGGTGTAWGWITVDAPPKARTWRFRLKAGVTTDRPEDYEEYDSGQPGGHTGPVLRDELGKLMGLRQPAHLQGLSIAASHDYYREHLDRAEGRAPRKIATPYWD